MKNNNIKTIYIYALCVFGLSSCVKDVLDKVPLDSITDAAVWNDEVLVDSYLTEQWANTYVLVNEVNANQITNGKGWFPITYPNKLGAETRHNWGGNVNKFRNGGLDINGGVLEWWEPSYKIIRALNELIERLPSSSFSSEFINEKMADARFLRAYNYFAMVKRYGGVPLITRLQSIDDPEEELFPTRNKEQEVYDFVLAEMDDIMNDLPQNKATAKYGKPTKYTALALKSRAALYAGSISQFGDVKLDGVVGIDASLKDDYYTMAYDAAQLIIDSQEFALYDQDSDKAMNFRKIFLDKNNSEVIMAVIHDGINSQQGGNGWGWDFIETPQPNGVGAGNADGVYLDIVEEFEYIDGSPGELDESAITTGLWTTEDLWRDKDPRFFASIYTQNTSWKGQELQMNLGIRASDGSLVNNGTYNSIPAVGIHQRPNGIGFGMLKFLDEDHDNTIGWGTSETDWLVFRYGEVLLNYAEAAFELGRVGDALDAVNLIRERAGIIDLTAIDREKIRHERKVELLFEGHRYWDVRRWRTAVDELSNNESGLRYILDYDSGKFELEILEKVHGTVNEPKFFEQNYYLPINRGRVANNPNLVENPGYEL